jgi:ABC-type nickel/cobalt efflux system permease component RcnA
MINGFVAGGYGLIWGSILWYTWRSWRRLRVAERRLDATRRAEHFREADER